MLATNSIADKLAIRTMFLFFCSVVAPCFFRYIQGPELAVSRLPGSQPCSLARMALYAWQTAMNRAESPLPETELSG